MVICLERGADCLHGPADATASQNPIISCLVQIRTGFYRAMLCIRGTSHGPVSVCLSVCLSVCVCLSQAGVLLKRQNVGSHKQHHKFVQGL